MNFIYSNTELDISKVDDFSKIQQVTSPKGYLLLNDPSRIFKDQHFFSVIDGYLRDTSISEGIRSTLSGASNAFHHWPMPDTVTGSFSGFTVNSEEDKIVVYTDLTNIYPIYYFKSGNNFVISNNLILIGRLFNPKDDQTGIMQRAVGPNFENIGSRTILKDCKSLLPGERICFKSDGHLIQKDYDNSLYQNIGSIKPTKEGLKKYWDQYCKEVELCTENFNEVNIALSGGLDSRVALGAIKSKKIKAHTFGNEENYESRIARKLAKIKGASHHNYFDLSKFFPEKELLELFVRETESVKLNSWLEILSGFQRDLKEPLLLGELCEGLPARNIKRFNAAKFRQENFFKYYIEKNNFPFTTSSSENFQKWKENQRSISMSWIIDFWFDNLQFSQNKNDILQGSISDLNEIFERIKDHNLPYSELYDELFSWFTFTRKDLSKQVTICNEQFYAFSPGMSRSILTLTSNIHPNHRLYYRFAKKLFSKIKDLKKLGSVPTSQIPLIPQNAPDILKIPIWGIRSKIDDILVRKSMNTKSSKRKSKLFKGMNWSDIYSQPKVLEKMNDYYSPNYTTKEYANKFINLANKRKNLDSWPFANMDIMSGVQLNLQLNLIRRKSGDISASVLKNGNKDIEQNN